MIRWLICFLWGHDIDKNDFVIKHLWEDEVGGLLEGRYCKYYCKRCQKYKRIS